MHLELLFKLELLCVWACNGKHTTSTSVCFRTDLWIEIARIDLKLLISNVKCFNKANNRNNNAQLSILREKTADKEKVAPIFF